jgi:hypothetical protein
MKNFNKALREPLIDEDSIELSPTNSNQEQTFSSIDPLV